MIKPCSHVCYGSWAATAMQTEFGWGTAAHFSVGLVYGDASTGISIKSSMSSSCLSVIAVGCCQPVTTKQSLLTGSSDPNPSVCWPETDRFFDLFFLCSLTIFNPGIIATCSCCRGNNMACWSLSPFASRNCFLLGLWPDWDFHFREWAAPLSACSCPRSPRLNARGANGGIRRPI